jgi:20S proteasome alpha/beta subunit
MGISDCDYVLTWCRDVLLGITGKDFTIVASSRAATRGATILKASDDKTRELNNRTLMAFTGEAGDTSKAYRCLLTLAVTEHFYSPVCGVHTSQHQALFNAQ